MNYTSKHEDNIEKKMQYITEPEMVLLMRSEVLPLCLNHLIDLNESEKTLIDEVLKIPSDSWLQEIDTPEKTLIRKIPFEDIYNADKTNKGLLMKMIESYQRGGDQDVKYWLAACIETFVRGNNPYF